MSACMQGSRQGHESDPVLNKPSVVAVYGMLRWWQYLVHKGGSAVRYGATQVLQAALGDVYCAQMLNAILAEGMATV